jgi:crotonobetainyl-CoA:carnitine CoA-transferase CaiB-like acyl-CoA transferase
MIRTGREGRILSSTWTRLLVKNIEAFGLVPKLGGTPRLVLRGTPRLGRDTEAVLSWLLGYDSDIVGFRGKGIIDQRWPA